MGDRLKVDSIVTLLPESSGATAITRQTEHTVTTRSQVDATGVTYTVPAGKVFKLSNFAASFDHQCLVYARLKKQTGGVGDFVTLFRIVLKQQGQDEANFAHTFPLGLNIGAPGDVFKVTVEAALVKGVVWTGFAGLEF